MVTLIGVKNSAGESDEDEASTHEKLSSAGKKGASTRWTRAKKRVSLFPGFHVMNKNLYGTLVFAGF